MNVGTDISCTGLALCCSVPTSEVYINNLKKELRFTVWLSLSLETLIKTSHLSFCCHEYWSHLSESRNLLGTWQAQWISNADKLLSNWYSNAVEEGHTSLINPDLNPLCSMDLPTGPVACGPAVVPGTSLVWTLKGASLTKSICLLLIFPPIKHVYKNRLHSAESEYQDSLPLVHKGDSGTIKAQGWQHFECNTQLLHTPHLLE